MYKKTADLHHLHERTASHATKGSATGLVEQRRLDETDFNSDTANALRWARIKELKKLRRTPRTDYWRIVGILKGCDSLTRSGLLPTLKTTRAKIKELNLEISELKAVTKRPSAGKVNKLFDSPQERRRYYANLHGHKNRLTK